MGQDRFHGEIECKIVSSNKISIIKCIHGQFLTKELNKKIDRYRLFYDTLLQIFITFWNENLILISYSHRLD